MISGSYDRSLMIWCLKTGRCKATLRGHEGHVVCLYVPEKESNNTQVWSLTQLHSVTFFNQWLLKEKCEFCCDANKQSRFVSVVLNGVLESLHLARYTCQCPTKILKAIYEVSLRILEGRRVSSKRTSRVRDWDKRVSSPMRSYLFARQANQRFFSTKSKKKNIWISSQT